MYRNTDELKDGETCTSRLDLLHSVRNKSGFWSEKRKGWSGEI